MRGESADHGQVDGVTGCKPVEVRKVRLPCDYDEFRAIHGAALCLAFMGMNALTLALVEIIRRAVNGVCLGKFAGGHCAASFMKFPGISPLAFRSLSHCAPLGVILYSLVAAS